MCLVPQEKNIHTSLIWELSHQYRQQEKPTRALTYRLNEGCSISDLKCLSPSACILPCPSRLYGPGCWSPCVSWELTGRSLTDCFSDSLVNNWSSDWKASHKMPKNICLSKVSRAINPVVVDRAKEHLLGLELHGTPAGNIWGLSYCRITLSPFHALSWTMTSRNHIPEVLGMASQCDL